MAVDFFDPTYMEAVYSSLLSFLSANTNANFPTSSNGLKIRSFARTFTPPDNVPAANQPALYMIPGPIHVNQKEIFAVAKWIFTTILMIYIQGDAAMVDQEPLSWTQANYVVWAIMNTLTAPPGPYQKQTLNDLVYHCWIEGEIHIEIQAPQVVVTIPVFILAGNLD